MKKGWIILIVILVICGVGVYLFSRSSSSNLSNGNSSSSNESGSSSKSSGSIGSRVLVVYFSGQGHTKKVAERISSDLNADIFEIEPSDPYSSSDLNWNDDDSRVNKEHNDESLRNIKLKVNTPDNWSSYDTIILGYPIWWGIAAWPVNSFVKVNDFSGKTVIPFCTSFSSGIGDSDKLLKRDSNGGNWISGTRFSQDASNSDIDKFVNSIN